jgi:hypothetical protein
MQCILRTSLPFATVHCVEHFTHYFKKWYIVYIHLTYLGPVNRAHTHSTVLKLGSEELSNNLNQQACSLSRKTTLSTTKKDDKNTIPKQSRQAAKALSRERFDLMR